ncbi:heterokaryon incompatibility, partial [Leptodontidium sp. 2 PMI_412]
YTALSYHWGDQSNKLPIYLSNTGFLETYDQASNFWVTESLHDALVQLRRNHYLLPGDSKHALWIDAICIDQDNIEERNEQVRRMGDIYQKAALIYIWLGPEENNSQLAWSKITVVVDNVRRFPFDRRQHTYNSWKDMHAGMMTAVVNPSWGGLESKGHEAMCHLLSRPWWTRAWIVQESTI